MVTIGGIFVQEEHKQKLNNCKFESLEFITLNENVYDIDVPCLTYKEINQINKMLPCRNLSKISVPGVAAKDIEKYVKLYRYFPYYMEVHSFN